MADKSKNPEKKPDKRLKNLRPPWKKGEPTANPNGRPLGQKNYATLYREALIKLATLNDTTPDELELEFISRGIMKGHKGDFKFYKDVLDRLLGTPVHNIDATTKGESLNSLGALFDEAAKHDENKPR